MTDRTSQTEKTTTDTASTDAKSVWVSNVIPGLTVQVIDPMPPSLGQQVAPEATASDDVGEVKATKLQGRLSRGLNRLAPKNDPRSKYRRSRLLRLRGQVTEQKALSASEPASIETEPSEPPNIVSEVDSVKKTSGRGRLARIKPADSSPAVASPCITSIEDDATESGALSDASQCSADLFPPDDTTSSDEVISISRSELTAHTIATKSVSELPAASTPSLPYPLPIKAKKKTRRQSQSSVRTLSRRPQRRKKKEVSDTEEVGHSEERYADWFRRVVLKNRWLSVFTTFYVHWLIVLVLAMMVVHGPENAAALILNGTFSDPEPVERETFDISVPEPVPLDDERPTEEQPEIPESSAANVEERPPELDESIMKGLLADISDGSASTPSETMQSESRDTDRAPNPAPARAVSEGSFSVWTEPSSPQAGEPYRIIIQIRLPPELEKYNVKDLQGVVVGSDGYRKPIPGYLKGFLPVQDGYARLVIPIVSADEHVRDTVLVKSRLLKESQKLLIAFEPGA